MLREVAAADGCRPRQIVARQRNLSATELRPSRGPHFSGNLRAHRHCVASLGDVRGRTLPRRWNRVAEGQDSYPTREGPARLGSHPGAPDRLATGASRLARSRRCWTENAGRGRSRRQAGRVANLQRLRFALSAFACSSLSPKRSPHFRRIELAPRLSAGNSHLSGHDAIGKGDPSIDPTQPAAAVPRGGPEVDGNSVNIETTHIRLGARPCQVGGRVKKRDTPSG